MQPKAGAIKRICVKKLFGSYDYVLSPSEHACNPDRLIILYGDNGSGKTTILRTLFHLLAPEDGEGHKTNVAAIPFSRFEVEFTSGAHIWAERTSGKTVGSFTMGLKYAHRKESTINFITSEDGICKATTEKHNIQTKVFLGKLQELNLGLFFLSDDRTVRLAGRERHDIPYASFEPQDEYVRGYQDVPFQTTRLRRGNDPEKRAQQLLVESMKRAEMWIQIQAVRGSSEGESSVNTLYSEILKRIAGLPLEVAPTQSNAVLSLSTKINELEDRSKKYSQYGLLPEFNGRDILAVVKSAPKTHLGIITNVITPYVESVEKKLDAMERLQKQIDSLVGIVNSFFSRKGITFEIHKGFDIRADNGAALAPHMLSSGERHLLLLFCNTLIALDRPSIFIIDEPEISLNIKWQRNLLKALLHCAGDNPVQYLFATHSFELLAQYKENTVKLEEIVGGKHGSEANS